MTLRYGLIGSGMMGHEHIRNVALIDGAEVVAVADPDPGMRQIARDLAGGGCAGFASHHEMLAAGGLDAVIIAAPNHLHHPILLDLMQTDLPILCEKPLCTTETHCAEIAGLQARRNAPLWVAMEYRYMPAVARLIEEVRKGTPGPVRMLSIREHRYPFLPKIGDWNRFNAQTGGTLVEKCCHFFDLMRLILQSDPVRVYASGAMDENHREERIGGAVPDILDNAYVVVDFASGARAMLDLCMFAEGSRWQEVISATGPRARVDAKVPGPARFRQGDGTRHAQIEISERESQVVTQTEIPLDPGIEAAGDHAGSTYYQHLKFLAAVRDGAPVEVGVADGALAVAVGRAAEESARSGQAVTIQPLSEDRACA